MFVFQFDRGYRRLNTTLKNRSKVPNTVDPLQVFCKNHPHVLCHVEMSYLVVGRFRSWNLRIRLSWWPPPGTLLSALVNIGPHDFKIHYARREKLSSYPLARSSPWPMWDPESLNTPPPSSNNALVVDPTCQTTRRYVSPSPTFGSRLNTNNWARAPSQPEIVYFGQHWTSRL